MCGLVLYIYTLVKPLYSTPWRISARIDSALIGNVMLCGFNDIVFVGQAILS